MSRVRLFKISTVGAMASGAASSPGIITTCLDIIPSFESIPWEQVPSPTGKEGQDERAQSSGGTVVTPHPDLPPQGEEKSKHSPHSPSSYATSSPGESTQPRAPIIRARDDFPNDTRLTSASRARDIGGEPVQRGISQHSKRHGFESLTVVADLLNGVHTHVGQRARKPRAKHGIQSAAASKQHFVQRAARENKLPIGSRHTLSSQGSSGSDLIRRLEMETRGLAQKIVDEGLAKLFAPG